MDQQTVNEGKWKAILAYATIIGTIIVIFMNRENRNPFARFHLRQAFGIFLLFYLIGILVSSFNNWYISTPFFLFFVVLWGYGLINAVQGVTRPVPLVGSKFQQWFTFIE